MQIKENIYAYMCVFIYIKYVYDKDSITQRFDAICSSFTSLLHKIILWKIMTVGL